MLLTTERELGRVTCMARKIRVEYEGAIYHLMSRGDRREPIFKEEVDGEGIAEASEGR